MKIENNNYFEKETIKVWLMNHYATPMYFDKAGRHYWFANYLNNHGCKSSVFCANTFLNKKSIVDTGRKRCIVREDANIRFVFVKTTPYEGNGLSRVVNMLSFAFNLLFVGPEYAKECGVPDIILASSVHPLTLISGILLGRKFKRPCVCEIRDLWPEAIFAFGKAKEKSILGRILLSGEHWIYKNATALIFTKEGDIDYLIEKGWTDKQGGDVALGKCWYINNGVDSKAFDKLSKEQRIDDIDLMDEKKFNVIYTGTIRPMNDVGKILDAAKLIQNTNAYPNIQFLIYGDGSELVSLQKRIKQENIKNVKMKGVVPKNSIPSILNHASLNLLNYSQGEYNWTRGNSSNKLFEYMASGKPILSTIHMGYSIIQKYDCGIELEQNDAESLAIAVIQMHDLDKQELSRLGNNARMGSLDFDISVLGERLMEVIQWVVKND